MGLELGFPVFQNLEEGVRTFSRQVHHLFLLKRQAAYNVSTLENVTCEKVFSVRVKKIVAVETIHGDS